MASEPALGSPSLSPGCISWPSPVLDLLFLRDFIYLAISSDWDPLPCPTFLSAQMLLAPEVGPPLDSTLLSLSPPSLVFKGLPIHYNCTVYSCVCLFVFCSMSPIKGHEDCSFSPSHPQQLVLCLHSHK